MIKPKDEVKSSENSAFSLSRTFLAGSFEKGQLFSYRFKSFLTSLKSLLAETFNMFNDVCLQSKFNNRLEYQPVWVY
ncbi:MAG TPA: hypothetical protein VK835_09630 [Bacteroidia bacterium]|jgi:hypothetical protein|nr:hypothetical protein [Bacteroidia bacterium]